VTARERLVVGLLVASGVVWGEALHLLAARIGG
jgi:hypothetical protein